MRANKIFQSGFGYKLLPRCSGYDNVANCRSFVMIWGKYSENSSRALCKLICVAYFIWNIEKTAGLQLFQLVRNAGYPHNIEIHILTAATAIRTASIRLSQTKLTLLLARLPI